MKVMSEYADSNALLSLDFRVWGFYLKGWEERTWEVLETGGVRHPRHACELRNPIHEGPYSFGFITSMWFRVRGVIWAILDNPNSAC